MKIKRAAGVWICYLALTLFYIISYKRIPADISKLLYLYPSFLLLTYCAFEILGGFLNAMHKLFVVICIASLATNFLLLALYYQLGVDNYKLKIGSFLISEFITAACIYKSGIKRGLFKNEEPHTKQVRMP